MTKTIGGTHLANPLGTDAEVNFWLNETITPWDVYGHGITRVLVHR